MKEFFKPSTGKLIIFCLIAWVNIFFSNAAACMKTCVHLVPFYVFEMPSEIDALAIPIMLVYAYVFSCVIVYIYKIIKSKSVS